MSTYPVEKLLLMWKNNEVTVEQVIGYLLQNVVTLEKLCLALKKEVQSLQEAHKK